MSGIFGGGNEPQRPTAPTAAELQAAQDASNLKATNMQLAAQPDVFGPFSNVQFQKTGTGPGGVDQYRQVAALSGPAQGLFGTAQGVGQGALPAAQQALMASAGAQYPQMGQVMDPTGMITQGQQTLAGLPGVGAQDAAFDQGMQLFQRGVAPQFERQRQMLETQMANQGLDPTSDAARERFEQLARAQYGAYADRAAQLQNQLFGQSLQAQGLGQQLGLGQLASGLQGRGQSLAEEESRARLGLAGLGEQRLAGTALGSLGAGQLGQAASMLRAAQPTPFNVDTPAPVNVAQLMQNEYNQNLAAYNAEQAQNAAQNQLLGRGLGGLAGGAIGAMYGGPAGAAAGYRIGSGAGGGLAGMF